MISFFFFFISDLLNCCFLDCPVTPSLIKFFQNDFDQLDDLFHTSSCAVIANVHKPYLKISLHRRNNKNRDKHDSPLLSVIFQIPPAGALSEINISFRYLLDDFNSFLNRIICLHFRGYLHKNTRNTRDILLWALLLGLIQTV